MTTTRTDETRYCETPGCDWAAEAATMARWADGSWRCPEHGALRGWRAGRASDDAAREMTILRAEAEATHNRALLATLDDAEAGSVDALVTIAKLLASAARARASLYCATCETITHHDRVGDHDVCERHDDRHAAR